MDYVYVFFLSLRLLPACQVPFLQSPWKPNKGEDFHSLPRLLYTNVRCAMPFHPRPRWCTWTGEPRKTRTQRQIAGAVKKKTNEWGHSAGLCFMLPAERGESVYYCYCPVVTCRGEANEHIHATQLSLCVNIAVQTQGGGGRATVKTNVRWLEAAARRDACGRFVSGSV